MKEMMTYHCCAHKVAALILQTVHGLNKVAIVNDSHFCYVVKKRQWTDQTEPDRIAEDVESWLDGEYYFDVNNVFASLRQLGREKTDDGKSFKMVMLDKAKTMGGEKAALIGDILSKRPKKKQQQQQKKN